jgi:Concanavalin A-like lectin/glucanases superfamily
MSNPISYSVSELTNALKKGNFYIGTNDVSKGPTSSTGYFDGITPSLNQYVIYYNKSGSNRIYYCTNGDQVYYITNRLKGQNFTTLQSALNYIATQSDMICTNIQYEPIVTNGLVINLDAGFVPSYPTTGATWYDLSGYGNNATMYNGLSYNSGGWMDFDGADDYCSINYNSASMSSWNTGQTISIWMYHNIPDGRRNPWDQAYGGYGTWTHEQGGSINYYYGNAGVNNQPYTSLASASVTKNVWNHMCVTRSTSTINWYKNGVLSSTQNNPYGTLANTTANIRIGLGYTGTYWQGRMAIIQAYNRPLTATEVLQNYNAQKARFGL